MKSPARPLRILAIVNLPWDSRLGAARVWIELVKEWEAAGHIVEKFCLSDAFPRPEGSRIDSALRQVFFPRRAAAYVRRNAERFDVIDGLIGVLPFSKSSLHFRGLVVARSVGLFRLYDKFTEREPVLWPDKPKGRPHGRLFHGFVAWRLRKNAEKSVRHCDCLNVPNDDECLEMERDPDFGKLCLVEPYGLSDDFRESLARAATPASERLRRQKICFIGMWSLRKGSRDWPKIMAAIRQHHPNVQFVFLGTMFDETVVHADLTKDEASRLICRTKFGEEELPALLGDCAVALFPSYIEGFGLAVLEQLAAGLPTIAYDVSGPRQILESQRDRLLTPVGDTDAIAARAAAILSLPLTEYEELSAKCRAIAVSYRWSKIARDTLDQYSSALQSLKSASPR
jgi:glycosyltransferase involved in cell wall biosynthesis